jgi:hypothetical protein
MRDTLPQNSRAHLHPGFVAMEYFALILNRSFVVFITPEGLRGWKFCGPVGNRDSLYFKSVEEMLDDPEVEPASRDFEEWMSERPGFFIPRKQIVSADFVPTKKWGMGSIPHSGKLYVQLTENRKREFILLGNADGEYLREAIISGVF